MTFHLALHVLVPLAITWVLTMRTDRVQWLTTDDRGPSGIFLWLMASMLIDVDHLLADPIYDPARCSIGFHPLHSSIAIPLYGVLFIWQRLRLLALGLLVHVLLDAIDCL